MNISSFTSKSLNRKERKAQRLLQHYATCERLARYLLPQKKTPHQCGGCKSFSACVVAKTCLNWESDYGQRAAEIDGKRISVALFKAERRGQQRAERMCNEPGYANDPDKCGQDHVYVQTMVRKALGVLPPGFFVSSDPRGYSCKIDGDNAQGKALIDAVGLPTDMGGYGLLSPKINGNR